MKSLKFSLGGMDLEIAIEYIIGALVITLSIFVFFFSYEGKDINTPPGYDIYKKNNEYCIGISNVIYTQKTYSTSYQALDAAWTKFENSKQKWEKLDF